MFGDEPLRLQGIQNSENDVMENSLIGRYRDFANSWKKLFGLLFRECPDFFIPKVQNFLFRGAEFFIPGVQNSLFTTWENGIAGSS